MAKWRQAHDARLRPRVPLRRSVRAAFRGGPRRGLLGRADGRLLPDSRTASTSTARRGASRSRSSRSTPLRPSVAISRAPGRLGDIEIVEEPGRIVFRFSPCGTGGRTFVDGWNGPGAGDGGTGARRSPMDDPDRFGVTTRPHDWSWGKAGVCLYCVHCCQLQERIPIRRFGYPLRVVDPPLWPQAPRRRPLHVDDLQGSGHDPGRGLRASRRDKARRARLLPTAARVRQRPPAGSGTGRRRSRLWSWGGPTLRMPATRCRC